MSNATQIIKPAVFEALKTVDNNILKLDTVSLPYINMVDRPHGDYDVNILVKQMQLFNGHCIIQTMFMNGEYEGKSVSNVGDEFVTPWIETIKSISPEEVMIYTIDRETPAQELRKASHQELDKIAEKLRAEGIKCQVSY